MMKQLKALVVKMPFEKDLGNVIQIARKEGKKIFKNPNRVQVVDIIWKPYGWVVVVQNGDGCISEQRKNV